MWTYDTDGVTSEFLKGATRGLWGMDGGKLKSKLLEVDTRAVSRGENEPSIPRNPRVAPFKNSLVTPSVSYVHIHLFSSWLRKMAVTVKIFWLSFRVFACVFPRVISSIFPFPFPYFVLFVLRYFPFHVVWLCKLCFIHAV